MRMSKLLLGFFCISLAGMMTLPSCSRDRVRGWVSGTIRIYHPDNPEESRPAEGIQVHLVDLDFVVDSTDYSRNEAAVIDQVTTNADGSYMMAGIPSGYYAVVPIPDTLMYRFELTDPADSVKFTVSEALFGYTKDFSAPDVLGEEDVFRIKISVINRPFGGSISVFRPVFLFNIFPTYYPIRLDGSFDSNADELTLDLHYGIFGYLYVVSNNFMVKAWDGSGHWLFTRWIANDYFNTPEYAHWEVDWAKQTISRIE